MWLIKVLAILLLQGRISVAKNCCPEHAEWKSGLNCTDGSKIDLYCPDGMYNLDPVANPNEDNYTLIEEELAFVDSWERVPSHRFCLDLNRTEGGPMALICFDEPDNFSGPWRDVLFGTLCTFSALFLCVTLMIYIALPELRDLQGKILMCAMSALLGAYVLLAIVQLNINNLLSDSDDFCKWLAFFMYYCFMAAFLWLNLVACNLWRTVWFKRFVIPEDMLFFIFNIIGWSIPGFCFVTAVIGHHTEGFILSPRFGVDRCWFSGTYETWVYLYGPVAFLTTLNVIYFALTCYSLWHKYKDFSGTKLKILRFKCLLYLKLVCVMGITWIFEVVSFATGSKWTRYWLFTDILNSLQGLIIFLLLVVTRKRVRNLLAKKKLCGLSFPRSWAVGHDEECEVELPDEEVELSQTD